VPLGSELVVMVSGGGAEELEEELDELDELDEPDEVDELDDELEALDALDDELDEAIVLELDEELEDEDELEALVGPVSVGVTYEQAAVRTNDTSTMPRKALLLVRVRALTRPKNNPMLRSAIRSEAPRISTPFLFVART
jgi:hypothetical protein